MLYNYLVNHAENALIQHNPNSGEIKRNILIDFSIFWFNCLELFKKKKKSMFSRDRSYPGDSGEPLHQKLITLSILFPPVFPIAVQATILPSTTHKMQHLNMLVSFHFSSLSLAIMCRKKCSVLFHFMNQINFWLTFHRLQSWWPYGKHFRESSLL